MIENNEIQHLHMPDAAAVTELRDASKKTHHITARVGGQQFPLNVEVGKSYPIGDSGYQTTFNVRREEQG